jgi:tetratricopeptide (TPR) repeat protein
VTALASTNRNGATAPKPVPAEPKADTAAAAPLRLSTNKVAGVEPARSAAAAPAPAATAPEVRRIAVDAEPRVVSKPLEPSPAPASIPSVVAPVAPPAAAPAQPAIPRYRYRSPAVPKSGDRDEAERQMAEGLSLQENYKLKEAVERYRAAIQADPSCFDACYNLGVASFALGDMPQTLDAYEVALAIDPSSMKARFNLAIALERAGYPRDAANELERLLDANPGQTRAYFNLGHLYADKLRELAKARACYLRVLELDPQHPQATAIRYWLEAHP